MAKARGRAYLRTDGGARDIDRKVGREVTLVYYPTSSSNLDRPIEATFVLFQDGERIRVVVSRRTDGGTQKLADFDIDA
jgi:hypothetical protein